MGRSSAVAMGLWLAGCAIPLGSNDDPANAVVAPDTVTGCALFAGAVPTLGVGHSVELPGGATLWTFDAALVADGRADGIVGQLQVQAGGCPGALVKTAIALPETATDTDFATPLDVVRAGGDMWQFYEAWRLDAGAPFGVKVVGRGIAKWQDDSGSFVRAPHLFWTADRPAYGQSALVDGAWLYAYGCESADNGWSRACYVARAPTLQIADVQAWQYATSVDRFTANPDGAQPILIGVGELSLRRHADGRLLATYIKPLDKVLQVRSALGPTGPFSAPHALAQCDAATGSFCVGGVQHPELDPDDATIALSFARASFDPLPADARWPRLVYLPLPPDLP